MFQIFHSPIPGCFELVPQIRSDSRGVFVKLFHADFFKNKQLETKFKEQYYSVSKKNVLRGLHFQTPPFDHTKLLSCLGGRVLDVVVDLRKDLASYGRVATFHLDAEKANQVYIPKGCAHGFLTQSETATLLYNVSSTYAPEHDSGILWSSIDFDWAINTPILSDRDKTFTKLEDFSSPF